MSRSYKKFPCTKYNDRFYQKYANRILRQLNVNEKISNGGNYKKYIKHRIWNWYFVETWNEYLKRKEYYENKYGVDDLWVKSFNYSYIDWYKTYKRK